MISGLSSVVGRYEGYVEKFAGDALLALFGAPIAMRTTRNVPSCRTRDAR